jgi:hypothetical protein
MTVVRWALMAREYVRCNRACGCLWQFNSLPTNTNRHEVVPIDAVKASPEQRDALLRIMSGLDTDPGAAPRAPGGRSLLSLRPRMRSSRRSI